MRALSIEARVWLSLLLLTAMNWLLTELGLWHLPIDAKTLGTAILALALVKVRLILRFFMEVRDAPVMLGRLFDGWLLLVLASLTAQLWISFG